MACHVGYPTQVDRGQRATSRLFMSSCKETHRKAAEPRWLGAREMLLRLTAGMASKGMARKEGIGMPQAKHQGLRVLPVSLELSCA